MCLNPPIDCSAFQNPDVWNTLLCSSAGPPSQWAVCHYALFPSPAAQTAGTYCISLVGHTEWGGDGRTSANAWDAAAVTGGYPDFHAQKQQWGQRWPEPQGGTAQPKTRCPLLRRSSLGLVHVATQPGSSGLPNGHLQVVFSVLLGICYCHNSFCVIIPVKQWPWLSSGKKKKTKTIFLKKDAYKRKKGAFKKSQTSSWVLIPCPRWERFSFISLQFY